MKISPKCERCEEPILPVDFAHDWPSRFRGQMTVRTHLISWVHYTFAGIPALAQPKISHTNIELCDGCWGDLLGWCNQPDQERLKIAAGHRHVEKQIKKVAEERRERQINNMMRDTNE